MSNTGPSSQSTSNSALLTTDNLSSYSQVHAQAHAAMGLIAVPQGTCTLLGDSRNDQATSGTVLLNGLTATKTALHWLNWYNALNNQPLQLTSKFALSGTLTSALAGQITSLLLTSPLPEFAFIWSGVNDLAQSVLPLTSFNNVKAACITLLNNGITPVVFLDTGSTSLNTATLISRLFEYNERLRGLADSDSRILVFNACATVWDPTGANWTGTPAPVFKTGYSADGTHLINLGGYNLGVDFGTWFTPATTKVNDSRPLTIGEYVFANNPLTMIANGLFTTTSGGTTGGSGTVSSGTVPASWTLNTGAAGTAHALSTAGGAAGNVLTDVITCSGASTVKLSQDAATAARNAAALGDTYQSGWELTVSAGTNLQGINVIHEWNDGTSSHTYYDLYCQSTSAGNGPQAFGPVQCQPIPMTLTTLPTGGWITTRIEIIFSGAGGATVAIDRVRHRKRLLS
jgi:hypothetical protein